MIQNVVLLGHQGCGKTMFTEAVLYVSKNSNRLGHIEEGNTVSDYENEEKKRKMSIQTSIIPIHLPKNKINFLDTPGYIEFIGERIQGIKAADAAMIFVSGYSGIKIGTQQSFEEARNEHLPVSFFINKLDKENSDFEKVVQQLKEEFGNAALPIHIPYIENKEIQGVIDLIEEKISFYQFKDNTERIGRIPTHLKEVVSQYRTLLMEAIAERDEELLTEYLEHGTLTLNKLKVGFKRAFVAGEIYPIMCGSSHNLKGISATLTAIKNYYPTIKEQKQLELNMQKNETFVAQIFKTIADPFVGKLSYFRVIQGALTNNIILYNSNCNEIEKSNTYYEICGKTLTNKDVIETGDIAAIAKLQYSQTGDTLCDGTHQMQVPLFSFPKATHNMIIIPSDKGDEERLSNGLSRIQEEDKTISVFRDEEFNDLHVIGMGDIHLDSIKTKLCTKFNVEIDYAIPKVPYRETIIGKADVQGKYKKQSGGHGQYGDVKIIFEHRTDNGEDLLFIDKVVGGAVPRQYIPAVEKGLQEAMTHGVLGGFPVIQLQATLYDGTYHPVDSSEFAFKAAASLAYKKGLEEAQPCLLEPIMQVDIYIPDTYIGDVIGDVNKRRGRILKMEEEKGTQHLMVEIPLAEILTYTIDLKSLTAAQGHYTQTFLRYEEVPKEFVPIILANHSYQQ